MIWDISAFSFRGTEPPPDVLQEDWAGDPMLHLNRLRSATAWLIFDESTGEWLGEKRSGWQWYRSLVQSSVGDEQRA